MNRQTVKVKWCQLLTSGPAKVNVCNYVSIYFPNVENNISCKQSHTKSHTTLPCNLLALDSAIESETLRTHSARVGTWLTAYVRHSSRKYTFADTRTQQ